MEEQTTLKWRFSWLVHFLLFVCFQVIFIVFDESKIWMIFKLNSTGERVVSSLHQLFDKFQLYNTEQLNYVTVVWIGILTLHGLIRIIEKLSRK
ncbi:YfzA family protein [Paenibacillus ihumii]|uniref:YfzA family protein n=1 Tax=Paenibacillus ihumii TaxID=687436 RepID=UPI0006D7EEA4|nr:YfzA family protein [Paenibacillus ihumii]